MCGFLKIVLEDFFFSKNLFYCLYQARVLFLNPWKDVQNDFRDRIIDTVETPKIGSPQRVADTSEGVSIHLLQAAIKTPVSSPEGNSLTQWSLTTKGGVPRFNSQNCANSQEGEVYRSSALTPASFSPSSENSVNECLLNAYCVPSTLLGALHRYLT